MAVESLPSLQRGSAATRGGPGRATSPSARCARPALPEVDAAAASVRAWAITEPDLAALAASGLTLGQAVARWGMRLVRANRAADACVALAAALALAPDDACLWTQLGVALDRCGRQAEAEAGLEWSLTLRRDQPDTWILLGLIRVKLGDRSGAERAYRTALEQSPSSTAGWQCLALVLEQQRDYAGAIDAYGRCVALGDASAALWANLGRLHYQTARISEACGAYEAAVRADPANVHYAHMLAKARFVRDVRDGAPVDEALEAYDRAQPAPGSEPALLDLLGAAFGLLSTSGHTEAASRIGRKRLELQPSSASAKYLLKALAGDPCLDHSPPEYIVETFDAFADTFDAKLVGVLGYDVPEQLCSLVRSVTAAGDLYDTLDAGCGTGLCGPLLRPFARTLTGIDLSAKMLEHAARRGVYDALAQSELTAFLEEAPRRFDLIAAADVLIYFGDLELFFTAAARAMRPRGLLAVSTEQLGPASAAAPGYRALASGRFAHRPDYVRARAAACFTLEACVETTLRIDVTERTRGHLFVFRLRGPVGVT
ncbi:MAG TPA: methyltransferase domain-containing protein [Polyangiaceae bacterium]|nr:methyltransferase domain-containing protein [Polyangiaceae bacterium]